MKTKIGLLILIYILSVMTIGGTAICTDAMSSTCKNLISVDNAGYTGVTSSLQQFICGSGNNLPFQLSQTEFRFNTDNKLTFRASDIYIYSNQVNDLTITAKADLNLESDTEIDITTVTVDLNGAFDVSGSTNLNGAVTLGDATSDFITITGYVASDIVFEADDTYNIGNDTHEVNDIFIDGVAHLDEVDIDDGEIDGITLGTNSAITSAVITTADINAGTFDGIIGGTIPAAGSFTTLTASGTFNADGVTTLNGTVTLGDASSDNIVFTGYTASSIIPKTTNSYSLGEDDTPLRWKNLYLSGDLYAGGIDTSDSSVDWALQEGDTDALEIYDGATLFFKIDTGNDEITSSADIFISEDIYMSGSSKIFDLNANNLRLDADDDTSIEADTDDQIDIEVGGADDFQFTADTFTALSGSSIYTDKIYETTGDAGVTIDGMKIENDGTTTDIIGTSGNYIRIGDATTTGHSLNSEDDLLVTGKLEVSSTVYIEDLLMLSGTEQDLTTSGTGTDVINATTSVTELKTGGAHSITISNGTVQGQIKIVYMSTDGGIGTLGGANFAGTSLVFDDVGDSATLMWSKDIADWFVIGTTATYSP